MALHQISWMIPCGRIISVPMSGYEIGYWEVAPWSLLAACNFSFALAAGTATLPAIMTQWPVILFACALTWRKTKHLGPRGGKRHILWTIVGVNMTMGQFSVYTFIGITYVGLLSVSPLLGTLFLPGACSGAEALFVASTNFCYRKVVRQPRRDDPSKSVVGDQKRFMIPFVVGANHAEAETCRLMSLLGGTLRGSSPYSWAGSALLSVFMNVLNRTGWTRWFSGRFVFKLTGSLFLRGLSCGNALTKMHDECKFSLGYPRFGMPLAVMLARAIVYQDFDPSSPHFFAFNANFLAAYFTSLTLEMVEDVIVHFDLIPVPPADEFDVRVYSTMESQDLQSVYATMDGTGTSWRMSLRPSCTDEPEDVWRRDELNAAGNKHTSDFNRKSQKSGGCIFAFACDDVEGPGDAFRKRHGQVRRMHHSTSLHGLRPLTIMDHLGTISVVVGLSLVFSDALFGPGYMKGVCDGPPPLVSAMLQGLWHGYPHICSDFQVR